MAESTAAAFVDALRAQRSDAEREVDPARLVAFLEEHRATMPRVTLRYAIENLPPDRRAALMTR